MRRPTGRRRPRRAEVLAIGGIELLPAWPVFLGFALAGLALNVIPGADMTFVIASAARGGRRDGIVAALGIGAGALLHILAATLGLSAILASSRAAFSLVKYVGAAYLLWVAFSLVSSKRNAAATPARPAIGTFRAAMLVNILNPKVALFFLAFLPQFVDPLARAPAAQILCLGLWFDGVGTLVNIAVALAAARVALRLRNVAWLARAARWFAATIMARSRSNSLSLRALRRRRRDRPVSAPRHKQAGHECARASRRYWDARRPARRAVARLRAGSSS